MPACYNRRIENATNSRGDKVRAFTKKRGGGGEGRGEEVHPRLWLRGPAHTQPVTVDLTPPPYRPNASQFSLFAYERH